MEFQFENWASCHDQLETFRTEYANNKIGILFRGQANSSWGLDTTLERATHAPVPVRNYYKLLSNIVP
ncbi:MAG: hypothetical protein KGM42_15445, partial [Hyphomicrobiales bacterium]|nr:hypothetical protein [Hyphomicrobiales bacterium]